MQPSQSAQPDPLAMLVEGEQTRLDRAVAQWRGISRSAALRLLEQGAVTCNGQVMRREDKGRLLNKGDRLAIDPAYAKGEAPRADDSITLQTLAQGEGWLVVNKPAGMPVRPHVMDEVGTVLNALTAKHPEIIGVGEGGLRSGVVHRLDNDTSGALLFATTQDAWVRFRDAFAQHRIQKHYAALVHGAIDEAGTVKRDLSVTSHRPARVMVQPQGQGRADARTCSLGWRVLERFGDRASLIEVDLHTGFLHQVRAMMSDLGHPVVGDEVYGDSRDNTTAPRQMLHAKSLAFESLTAEAPLPDDMQRVLDALRAIG